MKKYNKVLVGLDLGTDSVGWCVTDENGAIIKKMVNHYGAIMDLPKLKLLQKEEQIERNVEDIIADKNVLH